jgi:hypothetical protein
VQNEDHSVHEERTVDQHTKRSGTHAFSLSLEDVLTVLSDGSLTHQQHSVLPMYLPHALMLIDLMPTVVMFGGHMMVGGIWGVCADGMYVPPGLRQQRRGWEGGEGQQQTSMVRAWLVRSKASA